MKKSLLIPSLLAAAAVSANAALIGYWNFDNSDLDESSGGPTPDGLHDGEIIGTGVGYAAGPTGFGNALTTSGSGAVRILNSNLKAEAVGTNPDNPNYANTYDAALTGSSMTVSVWAKGSPGGWQPYVAMYGEGAFGYQLRRHSGNDGNAFTLRNTGGADDPQGAISTFDDNWHHIVGVRDTSTGNRYLYVDGVLDTAGSIQDGSDTGSYSNPAYEYLMIGGRNDGANSFGAYWTGSIDEVRIYNEALTQTQVQALMVPIPEPGTFSLASLAGLMLILRRRR